MEKRETLNFKPTAMQWHSAMLCTRKHTCVRYTQVERTQPMQTYCCLNLYTKKSLPSIVEERNIWSSSNQIYRIMFILTEEACQMKTQSRVHLYYNTCTTQTKQAVLDLTSIIKNWFLVPAIIISLFAFSFIFGHQVHRCDSESVAIFRCKLGG